MAYTEQLLCAYKGVYNRVINKDRHLIQWFTYVFLVSYSTYYEEMRQNREEKPIEHIYIHIYNTYIIHTQILKRSRTFIEFSSSHHHINKFTIWYDKRNAQNVEEYVFSYDFFLSSKIMSHSRLQCNKCQKEQ